MWNPGGDDIRGRGLRGETTGRHRGLDQGGGDGEGVFEPVVFEMEAGLALASDVRANEERSVVGS